MHTNKELTSFLKGFAILAVITSHFSERFMPHTIRSFGNHFVAIFFILSGYGIYFSLSKNKFKDRKNIVSFYSRRFARIYPLYWISFILNLAFDRSSIITISSLSDFLLLSFNDPPRAWFVVALIPCYVFAPLVFNLIDKKKNFFILYIIVFFSLVNIIFSLLEFPQVRCWMYRGIYLNHIILFCLGMYLPSIREKYNKNFNIAWVILSFLLMIYSFVKTSNQALFFQPSQLLFSISTVLFTYIFMFSNFRFPFFGILKKLGTYSYSLYLFEGMYTTALSKIHIIEGERYINAFWFILLFPGFFFIAACLEETINNNLDIKQAFTNTKNLFMYP
jgi:peptidoglycan/LPS O-acetylase OafA/YrhL